MSLDDSCAVSHPRPINNTAPKDPMPVQPYVDFVALAGCNPSEQKIPTLEERKVAALERIANALDRTYPGWNGWAWGMIPNTLPTIPNTFPTWGIHMNGEIKS